MKSAGSVLTVFRRELGAYFNAAIAYIFIIVFVLLNGGLFMTQFFLIGRAEMRSFFMTLPFLLAVFIPAVTMRQWAEEKRGNTLELLLTFPVPTHVLVAGKFLASLVFYLAALAGTFSIPIMISALGNPDMGTIISGYIGAFLLGAMFLSVGIFISGLCRDQIVAFILSMLICFGLHLLGTEFFASSIDGWIPGVGSLLRQFVGSAQHFEVFAKGVVDNRDVLYFLIATGIFMILNGFWLDGRMRPGNARNFTIAVAVSCGILLMTNWLFAGVSLGRFDMTEGKIHTISPASKSIIQKLKAPVTAKLYISPIDKMPTGMKTLEQSVIDKLDELRVHSKGNFDYKIIHMEAANVVEEQDEEKEESLEEQLSRKGIQPFQVRAVESDEVAVRLVYASLGLSYKEKAEDIIPQLMPERLHDLEYTILSKIYRLTLPETPTIAIYAPYEEKQVEPEVRALLEQLGGKVPEGYRDDQYETLEMALEYEGYNTKRIEFTQESPIPDDASSLVIVEPKELTERQKYEINRFLVGGGSVFISVQNYNFQYAPRGRDLSIFPSDNKPAINALLRTWGLEVEKKILVDEQHDMINLSGAMSMGPFQMSVPVKVPIQILINDSGMNKDISITSRLSPMFYLWGTALSIDEAKVKNQSLEVTNLLKSTKNSWTVPFKSENLTPADLERAKSESEGPFQLAIMVEGQFLDAYEGQDIPVWAEPDPDDPEAASVDPTPAVSIQQAPGKLILVGASSFLQKQLITGGGNLNFFMNSVDALTLGEELVTIRSKQPINRSLDRVSTGAKVGWRLFVTLLVPIVIALVGAGRVIIRKKAKQTYLNAYTKSS